MSPWRNGGPHQLGLAEENRGQPAPRTGRGHGSGGARLFFCRIFDQRPQTDGEPNHPMEDKSGKTRSAKAPPKRMGDPGRKAGNGCFRSEKNGQQRRAHTRESWPPSSNPPEGPGASVNGAMTRRPRSPWPGELGNRHRGLGAFYGQQPVPPPPPSAGLQQRGTPESTARTVSFGSRGAGPRAQAGCQSPSGPGTSPHTGHAGTKKPSPQTRRRQQWGFYRLLALIPSLRHR